MIKVSVTKDINMRANVIVFEIKLIPNSDPKGYDVLNELDESEQNLLDRALKPEASPIIILEALSMLMEKAERHAEKLERDRK